MSITRERARLVFGIAVVVLLFVVGFLYGAGPRFGSPERRLIGVYTGHGHTLTFTRDHRFSYDTQYSHITGRWSARAAPPTEFELLCDTGYTGIAALVAGRFAGERGDLALHFSDYWVVLERAHSGWFFAMARKSPNQAMQRTRTAPRSSFLVASYPFSRRSDAPVLVADLGSR